MCFIHHKTENDLRHSAEMSCCFCQVIQNAVGQLDFNDSDSHPLLIPELILMRSFI